MAETQPGHRSRASHPLTVTHLIVEHHEVAVADVEAGQVVAGVLGVKDVLVDDEGGAARLGCVAAVKLGW